MQTLLLTTCGSSLLTNFADAASDERRLLVTHANVVEPENLDAQERRRLERLIERVRRGIEDLSARDLAEKSAELHGLLLYYQGSLSAKGDVHWLIASDTWLGQCAGAAIQRVLEKAGHRAECRRIPDLRTDSLSSFHMAMSELVRMCAEEVREFRENRWKVVFNLTGGFKSAQGFMQALGMLYADESIYVFERTDELLRLPRLPIEGLETRVVRDHKTLFLRLAANLPVRAEEARDIPSCFLMEIDGQVALTSWGDIVWREAKQEILGADLLQPVTRKLRYGPGFEESVRRACADSRRMAIVNERILQLSRHLEDERYNPESLDFKKLKGRHDRWTHECDAWSDKDARRLYGHFENEVFVLDRLGAHLRP